MEQFQGNVIKVVCLKFYNNHGVGRFKLLINPLKLSQYNLIHRLPFTTSLAIGKVHAD